MGRLAQKMKITVTKSELLLRIVANRGRHEREYREAAEGYRKACREALAAKLEASKTEDAESWKLSEFLKFGELEHEIPRSYLREYDEVIEMVKFSSAETLVITGEQFRAWIRDEWDWMRGFKNLHTSYCG